MSEGGVGGWRRRLGFRAEKRVCICLSAVQPHRQPGADPPRRPAHLRLGLPRPCPRQPMASPPALFLCAPIHFARPLAPASRPPLNHARYWVNALSSNPLLSTRDLVAGQLADIGGWRRRIQQAAAGEPADCTYKRGRGCTASTRAGRGTSGCSVSRVPTHTVRRLPSSLQARSWRPWRARSAARGAWGDSWRAAERRVSRARWVSLPPHPPPVSGVQSNP